MWDIKEINSIHKTLLKKASIWKWTYCALFHLTIAHDYASTFNNENYMPRSIVKLIVIKYDMNYLHLFFSNRKIKRHLFFTCRCWSNFQNAPSGKMSRGPQNPPSSEWHCSSTYGSAQGLQAWTSRQEESFANCDSKP